jgi:hypothetical protein
MLHFIIELWRLSGQHPFANAGGGTLQGRLWRTVKACVAARIATVEVVHLDATLIRANVSWDAIVEASC